LWWYFPPKQQPFNGIVMTAKFDASTATLFESVAFERRSARAFLPQPIEQSALERIFSIANRAPSNCNSQPWITHVASGAAIKGLREKVSAAWTAGQITMDFPYDGAYHGVYKERQYAAAQAMYDAAGIKREDKASRNELFVRNFRFFDAPHVAFLFLPEPFGLREAADVGMYAQTLMLALTASGYASCPQTALGFFSDLAREEFGLEKNNKLLFGISFGIEDTADALSSCRTARATLADNTVFHR
jgi:nitroreductase